MFWIREIHGIFTTGVIIILSSAENTFLSDIIPSGPLQGSVVPHFPHPPFSRGNNSQKRGIRAGICVGSPAGIDAVIFSRVMKGGRFRIRAAVGLREGKGGFGDGGYDRQEIPDRRRCNLRPRAYVGTCLFYVGGIVLSEVPLRH